MPSLIAFRELIKLFPSTHLAFKLIYMTTWWYESGFRFTIPVCGNAWAVDSHHKLWVLRTLDDFFIVNPNKRFEQTVGFWSFKTTTVTSQNARAPFIIIIIIYHDLTWFYPSMDKWLHTLWSVKWTYLSISKLQRYNLSNFPGHVITYQCWD